MQKELNVSAVNSKPLTGGNVNLETPGFLKMIAARIENDINTYAQAAYDDGHRTHLGASQIGRECRRQLFYTFRWVKREQFDGRMLRLFQRGHLEEARYAEYLTGIGFTVLLTDEQGNQFRAPFAHGHGGGSLDALIQFPPAYGIPGWFLGEFKTNKDAGFDALVKSGVQLTKKEHFAQMCMYGSHPTYQLQYGAYFNTNKNDDTMHVEIVKLDWKLGEQMRAKAIDIIRAEYPPDRIAQNPTFWTCKQCHFHGICWSNEPVEINCRSCRYAAPIEDKKWFCSHPAHSATIPDEVIKAGCRLHETINRQVY